jgi:hypothetical protein
LTVAGYVKPRIQCRHCEAQFETAGERNKHEKQHHRKELRALYRVAWAKARARKGFEVKHRKAL